MITNEQIRQIVEESSSKGFNVSVRDICFVILKDVFEDSMLAYKSLFGNDSDFDSAYLPAYERTASIEYLKMCIPSIMDASKDEGKQEYKDITFDENKEEIIKLIEKTKQAELEGKIEVEKSLKIQADLRCKLNDKFKVQEEDRDQMIIVNTKYTGVCEFCGHEVEKMTKEIAMKKFNLIEKD